MIIEHTPRYYKNSKIANEILHSIDVENERLILAVEKTKEEFIVDTAEFTLSKYEEEFNLPIAPSISLEERRSRIKAKMRSTGTTTKALFKSIVDSWTNGDVDIIEDYANYKITIEFNSTIGIPLNIQDVKNAINEVKPAHLVIEYKFKYNTWQDVSIKTWGELEAYTWQEVLEKGVI